MGIKQLPENIELGKKYRVRYLGIEPFHASKPLFDFIDGLAATAWNEDPKIIFK